MSVSQSSSRRLLAKERISLYNGVIQEWQKALFGFGGEEVGG